MKEHREIVRVRTPHPATAQGAIRLTEHWIVPDAWRDAFARQPLRGQTGWEDLRNADLSSLALSLLFKYATNDGQKSQEEWFLNVISLFDRAIYAQRQHLKRKGGSREAWFHKKACEARERIYEIPLPGTKTETLRDLLRRVTPPSVYRCGWVFLLHRWRAEFARLFLKGDLLGRKYYLFLLRGLARLYGVELSAGNLAILADCAEAASTAAEMRRVGKSQREIENELDSRDRYHHRETLFRFFQKLEPVKSAILDDILPRAVWPDPPQKN